MNDKCSAIFIFIIDCAIFVWYTKFGWLKVTVKQVISDIRTYSIMSKNENYKARLFEAYEYLKRENVSSLEEFKKREDLLVGAFTYDEITIFDRIKNPDYLKEISSAIFNINNHREEYINNPNIGDELASFGKLGYTPKRDKLIKDGYIVEGLTSEEAARHFK